MHALRSRLSALGSAAARTRGPGSAGQKLWRGFASSAGKGAGNASKAALRFAGSATLAAATVGVGGLLIANADAKGSLNIPQIDIPADKGCRGAVFEVPQRIKLRLFTLDEVRADHGTDVWVTLEGGVYNVTGFLDAHPGGPDRINMINGYDLSVFWDVYKLHHRDHIRELLEEYRIGSLNASDAKKAVETTHFSSMYGTDPVRPRKAELRIPSEVPWNSEPPTELLVESFYTPNDVFFVRNHNPVPVVEAGEYVLEIEENKALGIKHTSYSLKDLQTKFPAVDVVSALQCAGNRQEEFVTEDRPLYVAPHWRNGAIGNAKWTGVRVLDVLRGAGMDVDSIALGRKSLAGMKIVNFIAMDEDETGVPYAGVIPIEKAIDPFGDAILAYKMNGETLPRDHGYPIRLLAPGHAGCRNVKWVKQIIVSQEASELDSGSRLDRHFAPDVSWLEHRKHVDPNCPRSDCRVRVDQGPVVQTLPVQSIVCFPADHRVLPGDLKSINVKGIAWSGAGRGICRVEVSVDGGQNFTAAELLPEPELDAPCKGIDCPNPESGMGRNWAWKQFEVDMPLPDSVLAKLKRGERVRLEVISKAIDGDFNQQPERMSSLWNVLGICVNHWSRSNVMLDPKLTSDEPLPKAPLQPLPGDWRWPEQKRK